MTPDAANRGLTWISGAVCRKFAVCPRFAPERPSVLAGNSLSVPDLPPGKIRPNFAVVTQDVKHSHFTLTPR